MKLFLAFLRPTSIILCLWGGSTYNLFGQRPWDRPFIFNTDSITQNSVLLPISLPRATFLFDSTGREISAGIPMIYQKRRYMSICYQIALDSLFSRNVTGTARTDSITKNIYCWDFLDEYFIATFRPLPAEIIHIDSAFTARIRVKNLKPNTQYFARACTQCLRANDDVAHTSPVSNIIKFTTLRETSVQGETNNNKAFSLEQNSPNPFSSETNISFYLPQAAEISLVVCDALGRTVANLLSSRVNGGQHTFLAKLDTLPSGVYVCRLVANGQAISRRMVVMR